MFTGEKPFDPALFGKVIELGVYRARLALATTTLTRGGIEKPVKRSDQRDAEIRLEQIAEVLDRLQWYGPWGMNPTAIKLELIRRAKAVLDKS